MSSLFISDPWKFRELEVQLYELLCGRVAALLKLVLFVALIR